MKTGAIALFGLLVLAPASRAAEMPAFVHATMCDVAAPIAAGQPFFQRQIRFERPVGRSITRSPVSRRGVSVSPQRGTSSRPAPRRAAAAQEAPENNPVLRPAVHFCVTPDGQANPIRYT